MLGPDLDALVDALLPFAKRELKAHGEFLPFAATMTVAGEIVYGMATTESELPDSQELIDRILAGMKLEEAEGTIRADNEAYLHE